ncbi:MAG: ATP-binding protein [Firmicutes bacterium]|nr:ATP-binding protein [Bacillota bacterium]
MWYDKIGDPTIADTIVDMIDAYKIIVDGKESMRKKNSLISLTETMHCCARKK